MANHQWDCVSLIVNLEDFFLKLHSSKIDKTIKCPVPDNNIIIAFYRLQKLFHRIFATIDSWMHRHTYFKSWQKTATKHLKTLKIPKN
jgi:hypothetical protein